MLKLTAKSIGGAVYVAVPHEANLLAFMSVPRFGSNYCFTLFRELSNKKWGNRDVVRKRRKSVTSLPYYYLLELWEVGSRVNHSNFISDEQLQFQRLP